MALELAMDVSLSKGGIPLRFGSDAPVVGVVGPSGAGKSTLLRVLAGLEPRARGTLRVLGEVWQDDRSFLPPHRRGVGWVPQDSSLFPHLNVRENLGYAAKEPVEETARWLGLQALMERPPRFLSGGERQRVALGRALLSAPRLLLLDEPFASLDRRLRERIAGELAGRCREQGLPVVLVSHDPGDLEIFGAERWVLEGRGLERG